MSQWTGKLLGLALCVPSLATAALIDRGNGMIYDSTLNVTWLQSINQAGMDWQSAKNYADGLIHGGFNDWRLPSLNGDGCMAFGDASNLGIGSGCTASELGHLFYAHLGGVARTAFDPTNKPPFGDIDLDNVADIFWFAEQYDADYAYVFVMRYGGSVDYNGLQSWGGKTGNSYGAWAVRDGDVVSSQVPEPPMLIAAALLAGLLVRRRR